MPKASIGLLVHLAAEQSQSTSSCLLVVCVPTSFCYQARHDSLDPQPDALQVKGKVNAITIDQCVRTGVVFEDLVAVCELVNSSSLQVQVTGRVPTIAIDKCDGVQVRCHVQRRSEKC